MAFLRTIVIIFIIFYVLRLFARYILPSLFVNYVNRKMGGFSGQQQRSKVYKKEGEVTIDYSPQKKQQKRNDAGEYIDYVEVKE